LGSGPFAANASIERAPEQALAVATIALRRFATTPMGTEIGVSSGSRPLVRPETELAENGEASF
jgi:hypothetical protein